MTIFSRNRSAVRSRLKRVRRELKQVNTRMRRLRAEVGESAEDSEMARFYAAGGYGMCSPTVEAPPAMEIGGLPPRLAPRNGRQEGRIGDYLASNHQLTAVLQEERRLQRNKAIISTALVVVVLLWLLYSFVI